MNSRFNNHHFDTELMESQNSPENSGDSPSYSMSKDKKIASAFSSKKRRAQQKRVVSVPIADVERLRLKGDQISTAPPSDSWTWRKYGQKPIKGSPYPRGYYRCSSSKGCPAKKQVERSRTDPNMLVVTYSCEHNHPNWPAKKNHHRLAAVDGTNVTTSVSHEELEEVEDEKSKCLISLSDEIDSKGKLTNNSIGEGPLINAGGLGWFTDFESISCSMLDCPILIEDKISEDKEMGVIFTMREEDESLFADLGELPECSTVFCRGMAQREVEQRRCSLATTL